jgi:PhoH-like ATPase
MAKKVYVLDTSVYLTSANALYAYGKNDIVVPMEVLVEIDKHKNRQDMVGQQARRTIRLFDELRSKGSLQKGVRISKGKGILRVAHAELDRLPADLPPSVPDHRIISTALGEKAAASPRQKVILVTRDINMRVICDSIGFPCESYDPEQAVENSNDLYPGFVEVSVDEEFVDRFFNDEPMKLRGDYFPNQFLLLVSKNNEKKTALARFTSENEPLRRVRTFKGQRQVFGVSARNKEQSFALDLLTDVEIPLVTLVGRAGSGKTLAAIAAGLEQVMGTDSPYDRLIVSRPVQPLGKDIGFLPGSMEEKMLPWLAPIQDNLQFLLGNDKLMLEEYMAKGTIEIEAISYIRGRSIAKAYMIIDEAQNLTTHELKTIVTRVGEGTKIVLTGDIEQIDNAYINDTSNGLAHAVERFKGQPLAGHVTLIKGERSEIATIASEIL